MYRGGGESIVFENLVTEESGRDLSPILGDSFEKPTGVKHMLAFLGRELSLSVYEPGVYTLQCISYPYMKKIYPKTFPKVLCAGCRK